MDIVYAAEKSSIAAVLGERLGDRVTEQDIEVTENPAETGSFLVRWRLNRYVLAPDGSIVAVPYRRVRRPADEDAAA